MFKSRSYNFSKYPHKAQPHKAYYHKGWCKKTSKHKCSRGLRNRLTATFVFVALTAVTLTTWITLGAVFDAQQELLEAAGLPKYEGRPWQYYHTNWNDEAFAPIHEAFQQIIRRAFFAAILAFFLASMAAAVVARFLTHPLQALTDGARRLAEGERDIKLELPPNKDELYSLTEAFNNLVEGLERQEQWRRNMVADIAHDLRTPLAVMRSEIEAMQDGVVALNKTALTRLHNEVMMLSRLVNDLRTLSLAESGNLPLNLGTYQVEPLLRQVIDIFCLQAAEKGAEIKLCPQPKLATYCDCEQVIRLLSNLVDNALLYGYKDGKTRIELGAKASEDGVEIWVRDHGEGLTAEVREKVFERFYRGDSARTRKAQKGESSSSGLGLAIAKAIARAHNGDLRTYNHIAGGAVFSLYLPAESHFDDN